MKKFVINENDVNLINEKEIIMQADIEPVLMNNIQYRQLVSGEYQENATEEIIIGTKRIFPDTGPIIPYEVSYSMEIIINSNEIFKASNNIENVFLIFRVKNYHLNYGSIEVKVNGQMLDSFNEKKMAHDYLILNLDRLVAGDGAVTVIQIASNIKSAIIPTGPLTNYIELYGDLADIDVRPKIKFLYHDKTSYKNKYGVGRAGATFVDERRENFKHEHNDDVQLSEKSLAININHVYERENYCEKGIGLGKGWRTNLHQYLVKSPFSEELGSNEITYVDSDGKKTEFYEKWYYEKKNEKIYVDKEEVYIDGDQKLKYLDENKEEHEIKYECTPSNDLQFVSASSLYNYRGVEKVLGYWELYLQLRNERIPLERVGSRVKVPHFYIKQDLYHFDMVDYLDVELVADGEYLDKNGNKLTVVYFDCDLLIDKGGLKLKVYKKAYDKSRGNLGDIFESFWHDKKIWEDIKSTEIIELENSSKLPNEEVIDVYINEELQKTIENINNMSLKLEEMERSISLLESQWKNLEPQINQNTIDELKMNFEFCENQLISSIINYNEHSRQKDQLIKRKEYLIEQQLFSVNDFIIDQEGRTLGFDGYGRLILIQDKYENKIEIEYGKDEYEGKIINVHSEQERILFNYDKETSLLSSITDTKGRKTKFKYENDELVGIIYPDNKETRFDYSEGFKVTSPMLETLSIIPNIANDTITVRAYCYNGVINEDEKIIDTDNLKNISDELYIYHKDSNETILRDKKISNSNSLGIEQDDLVYSFNDEGKIIKQSDKEITIVKEYQEDKLISLASYKTDEEKSVLKYLSIYEGPCTYSINLSELDKLPISNMLGIKLVLLSGGSDNITFTLKAKVKTTNNDGQLIEEVFEETYVNRKLETIVMPIKINRDLSYQLDIEITSQLESFGNYFAAVDLISLLEGQINTYDEEDRLIEEENGYTKISYSDFNEEDIYLTRIEANIYGEEVITHYTYNDSLLLTSVSNSKNEVEEYCYDELGNLIEKRSYNKLDASLMKIEKVTYDMEGNQVYSCGQIKDNKGDYPSIETSFIDGKRSKIKGLNKETSSFCYDFNNGELLSISSDTDGINNSTSFKYNYGLLTSLSHHGVRVNYVYDGRGRKTKILLNDVEMMWNQYNDDYMSNNDSNYSFEETITHGKMNDSTTLDGLYQANYYDDKGRIKYSKFSGDMNYGKTSYIYEEEKIKSVECEITERENNVTYLERIKNTYDEYNRQIIQEKFIDNISTLVLKDNYDERFLLSNDVILNQEDYRLSYFHTYDKDNRLTKINVKEGIIGDDDLFIDIEEVDLKYDAINRITHKEVELENVSLCHEYSYLKQDENSLDLICEDITKIRIKNGSSLTYLSETNTYRYDVNGNITHIISDDKDTRYTYDSLNRLVREDNPYLNKTIVYKYDQAGNLLLKKNYTYSLDDNIYSPEVDEYIYDCEGIRDRLIAYNNQTISYDEMGRPTTYKDDEYEWNNLGQLRNILTSEGDEIEYLYDASGIRRKKIVNGIETEIITSGSQVLALTQGNNLLVFRYTLNKLIGFNYNNGGSAKEYIYDRNIQGDIIGIYDSEGNHVGGYAYDAYGNHVLTLDIEGIGSINPFRYRGYFYDSETRLYYLNSRYYDSETGRFISPDVLSILEESKGQINGLNLYMYCNDNPIMYVDPSGYKWWEFWKWDWGKIGTAILSAAKALQSIVFSIGSTKFLVTLGLIANDIYQIASGNVRFGKDDEDSGMIVNSNKIMHPISIIGYSYYLKYFSKDKNYFEGDAWEIAGEWFAHNLAYVALGFIRKFWPYNFIENSYKSAETVNIGSSLKAENRVPVKILSILFAIEFMPAEIIYSVINNILKGKN